MFEKTKIGNNRLNIMKFFKNREHWKNSWENGMLGHSQRERKRADKNFFIFFSASLFSRTLLAMLLACRWICRDEKPSPATGSCKSPAFSSFSYFPKIISNNLTLADNPKLQQKSTNSVFIKKPHQRNSTLSLSIAGEN